MYVIKADLGKLLSGSNCPGLKVNDQLVAYATRFFAVRLKNHLWSHHRTLKAKVQCDFSSAHSPDRTEHTLNDKYKCRHRYSTTRHQIIKLHHFPFTGLCSIRHFQPNFPVDSPSSNIHFFPMPHVLCCKQLR